MERIYLTKDKLLEIEQNMKFQKHLDRYFTIRQFCYGTVIDSACGVGYGSYIISTNPDVSNVYGVDIDKDAIDIANREYYSNKIHYQNIDISSFSVQADMLVSIETIEHLEDPTQLSLMANRCGVNDLIISYPTKKSTHFNKYHIYDLTRDDILSIFKEYKLMNSYPIGYEVEILIFTKDYSYDKKYKPIYWRDK